ncbi:hypothetical protein [Aestuariivirga sp.]|uniref:hypothetical protein n=1 Tax=Aestuariivirga sp. TaxID=2650926 RepID=UPI0025C3674B|nr:hypothetical protein [Aestuariivirga sp.]MCA3554660.1 hypothetical protein [Aestuariivirga sp.]
MDRNASKKPAKYGVGGSQSARVAGIAADGVVILRSRGPATHFTQREADRAVEAVLAARGKNRDAGKKS